jgi:hypothetical protein
LSVCFFWEILAINRAGTLATSASEDYPAGLPQAGRAGCAHRPGVQRDVKFGWLGAA